MLTNLQLGEKRALKLEENPKEGNVTTKIFKMSS